MYNNGLEADEKKTLDEGAVVTQFQLEVRPYKNVLFPAKQK